MYRDNDETRLCAVRGFAYLLEDHNRWEAFLTAAEQEAPALWNFLQFATEAYARVCESLNSADDFVPEQSIAELETVLAGTIETPNREK